MSRLLRITLTLSDGHEVDYYGQERSDKVEEIGHSTTAVVNGDLKRDEMHAALDRLLAQPWLKRDELPSAFGDKAQ